MIHSGKTKQQVVLPLGQPEMDLTLLEQALRQHIDSFAGDYPSFNPDRWSQSKREYYYRGKTLLSEITAYIKSPKITIEVDSD